MRYDRKYLQRRYREESARAREAECPEVRSAHRKLAETLNQQLRLLGGTHPPALRP